MRQSLCMLVAIIILSPGAGARAQTTLDPASFVVTPGSGIGSLKIGMPIQQAYEILGKQGRRVQAPRAATSQEEVFARAAAMVEYGTAEVATHQWFLTEAVYDLYDPHIFVIENTRGQVGAIGVKAERRFRMADGVGLGSREDEVRSRLGAPQMVGESKGSLATRQLYYFSHGLRLEIVLNEYNEIFRSYRGTAFELLVFCRWKSVRGGWELDSSCADSRIPESGMVCTVMLQNANPQNPRVDCKER